MSLLGADHRLARVTSSTPHRHPMLLVDEIEHIDRNVGGAAWKMVSSNESHQEGAEDSSPDGLPSSLLVDSMGQLAIAVLSGPEAGERPEHWLLASIESMEFKTTARCGDRLRMEAEVVRSWRGTSRVRVRASVEESEVARGVMVLSPWDEAKASSLAGAEREDPTPRAA